MTTRIFLIIALLWGGYALGQGNECKVIPEAISGSYSGGCKHGLAHGKGISKGIDTYEGEFVRGLPDGTGTYTWSNGSTYTGEFKRGLKQGKGKLVTADSTLEGIWKEDAYVGKVLIPPYVINRSLSVARSTITKQIGNTPGIKLRIMMGGNVNSEIEDFSLAYDSGDEYKMGPIYGLQNTLFPVRIYVRYRTWNQLHSVQYDVYFDFTINEPGSWEVVLTN